MKQAIKKILKNYVFRDSTLPYFEIETGEDLETGRTFYWVKTIIPKDHEVFKSEERQEEIRGRMRTALTMLGFSGVQPHSIFSNDDEVYISVFGYLRTNR
jgi:hypothetical protein